MRNVQCNKVLFWDHTSQNSQVSLKLMFRLSVLMIVTNANCQLRSSLIWFCVPISLPSRSPQMLSLWKICGSLPSPLVAQDGSISQRRDFRIRLSILKWFWGMVSKSIWLQLEPSLWKALLGWIQPPICAVKTRIPPSTDDLKGERPPLRVRSLDHYGRGCGCLIVEPDRLFSPRFDAVWQKERKEDREK